MSDHPIKIKKLSEIKCQFTGLIVVKIFIEPNHSKAYSYAVNSNVIEEINRLIRQGRHGKALDLLKKMDEN